MATDPIQRMRSAFRGEATDLLAELDSALLEMEASPRNRDLIGRVFRAIHTIKGSGATAGLARLAAFAHHVESVFDHAREGRLTIDSDLIDNALSACDVMKALLSEDPSAAVAEKERAVTAALQRSIPDRAESPVPSVASAAPPSDGRVVYEIAFRPHRDLFFSGTDPMTLLSELRRLGAAHVTTHTEGVPLFSSLEPESCYLWWEIRLVTDRDERAIREVFEFVEDDCELEIRRVENQVEAVAFLGNTAPETLDLFAQECEEHLASVEHDALVLEADPNARSRLDSIFRAMHSIKGNAALLLGQLQGESLAPDNPLRLLLKLTHAAESLLEDYRNRSGESVAPRFVETIIDVCDAQRRLLGSLARQTPAEPLPSRLLDDLGLGPQDAENDGHERSTGREAAFQSIAAQCMELIGSSLARLAGAGEGEPEVCRMYLRGVKTFTAAIAHGERGGLQGPLRSQARILEEVLEDGRGIAAAELQKLRDEFERTRALLALDQAPGSASPSSVRPAATPLHSKDEATAPTSSSATIRIDQEKLDRLLRVVGELLVARGVFPILAQKASREGAAGDLAKDIKDAGANISRIAEELQASVMSIRMLPVKTVFQRFPRMVRDLARNLGKEVEIAMEGEGTELDKTILEQIADPLVHLVRNAVDHGIEMPEERERKGKPRAGRLTLRAATDARGAILEVGDDGRGLDTEELKRKAIEKGLLPAESAACMSESAAFQLIFAAGLSTAAKVTDVSGRGVGMDVVANNIRQLQGTIDVQSSRNAGTTIAVRLPTSLMVSKGILLEAASQEYILPLTSIRDMAKLPVVGVRTYRDQKFASLRGNIYPLFTLAEIMEGTASAAEELSVAVVEAGQRKYGLVADRFVSEVEVIVKPLNNGLEKCKEFLGAAIMGDGRVVLVLNPTECCLGA